MGEADKEYQSIVGLVREVEAIVKQHQVPGGLQNPYTTLTAHVSFKPHTHFLSITISFFITYITHSTSFFFQALLSIC